MTFLNPIFLWASFAIAIPIIVHLFNFQRPKRVQFPDISLVKEVKQTVVKRVRLRQYLLLLMRCLAILALVMVFANPVIQDEGSGVVQGNSSVALVVDNSYSMRGANDKGSYWLQAQKIGREILQAYGRNDEFLVMSTHEPKLNFNFGEQQAALKSLKDMPVRQNVRSLPDLLTVSEDIFSNASNERKTLYLISDFQESTVVPDSNLTFPIPDGVEVNLVPLATRDLRNAYIKDHAITTQIVEKDKPVTLELQVVNDSPEPLAKVELRVVINGQTRPAPTINLQAGENQKVEINLIPKTAGWQSGYIEIDDSEVDFDNRRYFTYYVPEREKMLVVEEQPVPNLRLMLSGEVLSQFDVKFVSGRDFGEENLDQYKSIVFVGLNEISSGLQDKLIAHLQAGKSILYFPGQNLDLGSTNRFFQALQLGTWSAKTAQEQGQYAAGVDLDHPVFEGVYVGPREQRNFDSPLVYQHYPFRPTNSIVQNTILRLENQDAILVESKPEGGLFFTFAFHPETSWTDFTLKSSGLALMVQLSRIMNQAQQVQQNEDIGGGGYKRVKTAQKDVIKMVSEGETEIIPEQFVQSGYIVLKFERQDLNEGNYDLIQNEQLLEKISFNVPDEESTLASLSEQELKDYFAKVGVEGMRVSQPVEGAFAEQIELRNEGQPLWKYFLIAGLLFLLIEVFLLVTKEKNAAAA